MEEPHIAYFLALSVLDNFIYMCVCLIEDGTTCNNSHNYTKFTLMIQYSYAWYKFETVAIIINC